MTLPKALAASAVLFAAACAGMDMPSAPEEPASAPSGPVAIPAAPTENYACGPDRLAVRLLGATAEVRVNGAEAVSLPVLGDDGTTYTNGRMTIFIKQGNVSYAVGRRAAQACVAE